MIDQLMSTDAIPLSAAKAGDSPFNAPHNWRIDSQNRMTCQAVMIEIIGWQHRDSLFPRSDMQAASNELNNGLRAAIE